MPEQVAQALHVYLMTRPCNEAFELVLALRQAVALTRTPRT